MFSSFPKKFSYSFVFMIRRSTVTIGFRCPSEKRKLLYLHVRPCWFDQNKFKSRLFANLLKLKNLTNMVGVSLKVSLNRTFSKWYRKREEAYEWDQIQAIAISSTPLFSKYILQIFSDDFFSILRGKDLDISDSLRSMAWL